MYTQRGRKITFYWVASGMWQVASYSGKNYLVGWCMSEYNTGSRCELGIATAGGW